MTDTAKPFLINVEDIPWEPFARGRFGSEDRDLTQHVRARKLDVTLTRLAPGQVSCPYHFHHAEDELYELQLAKHRDVNAFAIMHG